MTDKKLREVRAALDTAIANHGEPEGQEHSPAVYATVLVEVAEKCEVTQSEVLEVNRERWRQNKAAA